MRICSAGAAEQVKRPAPRSWQKRSTVRIRQMEIPAHSVMRLPLSSSAVYLGKSFVSFCLHFFFKYCVYWRVLHWVVTAARGLSLAAAGGDSSRVAVHGGLAVVVFLLQSTGSQARRLQSLARGRSSCGCGV